MTNEKQLAVSPMELTSTDLAMVMKVEAEKRGLITQYISQHMKSGTDYGTIKFGSKESKPSLFKPGSEKFLSLFKLTAQFDKDTDTWEMAGSEKGVFAYKCRLLDSKKRLVGEGRGVSKLTEKVGWTINNAVKIAEKRAQIDAVLRTGALSDFFTQDLEDIVQQNNQYDQTPIKDSAVPTVTYDDHEGDQGGETESGIPRDNVSNPLDKAKTMGDKPLTKVQKERRIVDLANDILINPFTGKREELAEKYRTWVYEQTGFLMIEEHYDQIITKLKTLKNE